MRQFHLWNTKTDSARSGSPIGAPTIWLTSHQLMGSARTSSPQTLQRSSDGNPDRYPSSLKITGKSIPAECNQDAARQRRREKVSTKSEKRFRPHLTCAQS